MSYSVAREDLDRLEPEWRSLLARTATPTVFRSPAWLRAWWDEFADGRELALFTVRGDSLIAVAPLMQEGSRLAFAGDPQVCDYMDFTTAPGAEAGALSALFAALVQEPWQELSLWGLADGSPTLQLLPELAGRLGLAVEVDLEDVCPRVELPATWEEYQGGLSKKDRHELRRKRRRLSEAGDADLECLRSPDDVAAALDDFLRLHATSRTEKALFMTGPMARFFRRLVVDLAGEGQVRLYFLRLNGVRTAGVLCFEGEEELLLYNSGYDPAYASSSVGVLSKALALEKAIGSGKRCFDFLRGAEPYKYDLGARDLNVYRCVIRRT
ncbi:MAG: GNAT family N-acetyltransferase [Chloroflexi bacterium]|nr:GNAT family N-acetyltransferase [Chloroflexota bacterium]